MFNDIYSSSPLPPNEKGFQANCGIRIRGGFSRDPNNPKHAWRVFFRREYGDAKLNYPVFQTEGVDEFDAFDIQTSQNYSWAYQGSGENNFLRELWCRDTQRDTGNNYARGRFVHLYINAQYWGLFQIEERPENSFGASYLGGNPDNMDVIKATGNSAGYTVEATDGNFLTYEDPVTHVVTDAPWKMLWDRSRACYFINTNRQPTAPYSPQTYSVTEKNAAFFRVLGLAADGKTPIADPVLIDIDDMIDMMLIIFFSGNTDAPLSNFIGNNNPNNFYAIRDRTGNRGFISPLHDGEHSLNASSAAPDRVGPTHDAVYKNWYFNNPASGTWNDINYSNQQFFHQDFMPNPEYRLRFADRIYKHMFNNGPMTTAQNLARFDARAPFVEAGIFGESARWGDSKVATPFNRNHWITARNASRNWFNGRFNTFLTQAKTKYLYPSVDPPVFNQRGGSVAAGFQATLSNPNAGSGTIYYTTDGSDPRPAGFALPTTVLVPEFPNGRYLVPSAANGGSSLTIAQWTGLADPANAASWTSAQLGYGFNPAGRPASTNFTPFIKTNVQPEMLGAGQPPPGINATLYVRLPFSVTQQQKDAMDTLRVRVRFDDAVIVYLNGTEVGRKVVSAALAPTWNSASGTSHADTAGILFETVDMSNFINLVQVGTNVVAIHVLNSQATNTDLLVSPMIEYDTLVGPGGGSQIYAGPVTVNSPMTIRTRFFSTAGEWSALNEAAFVVNAIPASASNLVVSEFSYNPAASQNQAESAYSSNDFEFIELQNISTSSVDLTGVRFAAGVLFDFTGTPQQLTLPPGGRTLVVGNLAAFQARYGMAAGPIFGAFTGSLTNDGERVLLTDAGGNAIKDFTYLDEAPWPGSADGDGYSLVLIDPPSNPDHGNPSNWRSSVGLHGDPGAAKTTLTFASWKLANGVVNDNGDPDLDGLTNLMEYAFASSPAASSTSPLPDVGVQPFTVGVAQENYLVIRFTRALGADDLEFIVENSSNLSAWATTGVILAGEVNNGDGTATMTYRSLNPIPTDGQLFLRLRVALRG